jgi:hypothetical protein
MTNNYFKTPADPEGFGVNLPERNLRAIDFSALEFDTLMRAVVEYVRTYYRDEFNDFVTNNGFMMVSEIVCYVGSVLAQRLDILANESFLPTSQSVDAIVNHLDLIGQRMQRQTPATTQVMCNLTSPVSTNVHILAGMVFNMTGPDGEVLYYELFAAPYDWDSEIVIPAEKFATIGWAIEGRFSPDVLNTMVGGASQVISINDKNVIDDPIIVVIDDELWSRVSFLEQYGPNDRVYVVDLSDESMTITFGDDINGKAPLSGQQSKVRYRTGGGVRGRIGTGIINQTVNVSPEAPVTAPVPVTFINTVPSSGGYDQESNEEAKKRAPKNWATHENIATAEDYVNASSSFRHPVYGGIAKAVAAVYTSINANRVIVSALAEGEGGAPVQPNEGLKNGLRNSLNKVNVMTDDVEVNAGKIRPVDLEMVVVLYKNADAGTVKESVDTGIDDFFDLARWNMGQPLYVSALYDQIMSINGVKFVNIFNPGDDILPEEDIGTTASNSLAFDELITLGNKNVKIYYEK